MSDASEQDRQAFLDLLRKQSREDQKSILRFLTSAGFNLPKAGMRGFGTGTMVNERFL